MGNSDEGDLVRLAIGGNREAYALLVRLHYRRVYRVALRLMRNADDAAEICQETFVRAMNAIHRFDASRQFFPWLYQIARNLSLNHIERVYKRETPLPELELSDVRESGPETETMRADAAEAVRRAIDRLPEQYRTIIRLNHFDECSYQEIADILEIPIGTVMSRLYNARKKLREALVAEDEDHAGITAR